MTPRSNSTVTTLYLPTERIQKGNICTQIMSIIWRMHYRKLPNTFIIVE